MTSVSASRSRAVPGAVSSIELAGYLGVERDDDAGGLLFGLCRGSAARQG